MYFENLFVLMCVAYFEQFYSLLEIYQHTWNSILAAGDNLRQT